LTLLVGHQEEHLACKKLIGEVLATYLSGARCKGFEYGPTDVTATPSLRASLRSKLVQPFWDRITGCPGKEAIR